MAVDREDGREGFLRRWSRVKIESLEASRDPATPAMPTAAAKAPEDAPPELPPIEKLTFDSDFSGFFHPKVDEDVRRNALRKLFSDPHFNVMDGLDVYIDDYSKTEPIPAAMLASLKQAQRIFEWAAETKESAGEAEHPSEQTERAAESELASAEPVPTLDESHGEAASPTIGDTESVRADANAPVAGPGTP